MGSNDLIPKPDHVTLDEGEEWKDLTPQRRFYLRNKEKHIEQVTDRKQRLQKKIRDYKTDRGCRLCGIDDAVVLQLHHLNPDEKDYSVANMPNQGLSWERIKEEIEKCAVLCANCHLRIENGDKEI